MARLGRAALCVAACGLLTDCSGSTSGQKSDGVADAGTGGDAADTGVGGASGTAGGGTGGGTPGAGGAAPRDASAESARPSDGATPVCPVTVTGGLVSGADCYACIPPEAPCDPRSAVGPLRTVTAADCATLFTGSASFRCAWYPDGVAINLPWGAQVTCLSNPGRIICGGGL